MKKYLVALICSLTAICMCACGNGNDGGEPAATDVPTAEPTQAITPEPTYLGMINEYGVWFPEPPFDNWEGTIQDNTGCYEMSTRNAYYDPASDGAYESVNEMFKAYAMSFADFGFTVAELDADQYKAEIADGARIYLTYFGDGYAQITIYK